MKKKKESSHKAFRKFVGSKEYKELLRHPDKIFNRKFIRPANVHPNEIKE